MKFLFIAYVAAAYSLTGVLADNRTTSKIDVHAHYVPDFYAQALRDAGHVPGPDGMPAIPNWDPDTHLKFMSDHNIVKSYLSISSPGVYLTVPSKDATKKATKLARQVNDYGAQLKAQYPNKFGFFASLPLPDIQASLEEIAYCFNTLKPKPDGVVLMSNFYGMYLGDPKLDPIYSALNELNVTIFEHPTMPCSESNYLAYSIDDDISPIPQKEWQAMNRPVATRQFATPTLDFPFESARTFADLFYTKVPSRFPQIKWIIPHAGGGLLPTIDRVVAYSTLYPGLNLTATSMKTTLAQNFYFDLAGPWAVDSAIPSLLRWVDFTRILWGTDLPFTPWTAAPASIAAFDKDVEKALSDPKAVKAVRRENAVRLFGR